MLSRYWYEFIENGPVVSGLLVSDKQITLHKFKMYTPILSMEDKK